MIFLAIGMLALAFGLIFVFRPNSAGESHPAVSGVAVSSLFPAAVLMLVTFGLAILISEAVG